MPSLPNSKLCRSPQVIGRWRKWRQRTPCLPARSLYGPSCPDLNTRSFDRSMTRPLWPHHHVDYRVHGLASLPAQPDNAGSRSDSCSRQRCWLDTQSSSLPIPGHSWSRDLLRSRQTTRFGEVGKLCMRYRVVSAAGLIRARACISAISADYGEGKIDLRVC